MGRGFRVSCPDCRHEWEGIETSFRFGSWSTFEHPNIHDGFRAWFCPRCYWIPQRTIRSSRGIGSSNRQRCEDQRAHH